jgi:TonB family protein
MFGNLIESRSHTTEFARRGYFLVLTIVGYGVLLCAFTVASVYAYDASLQSPDLEMLSMVTPLPIPEVQPAHQPKPQTVVRQNQPESIRPVLIAQIRNNTVIPDTTSTKPSPVVEVPNGTVRIGNASIDAAPTTGPLTGPPSGPVDPGTQNHTLVVDVEKPPQVPPPVEKRPLIVSKGPITGQAISLPKPVYSQIAIQARASGAVRVQVVIDESGKVVSAQILDGHPLLRQSALQAAWQARFSPTMLGGAPVKVSGYIVYNFSRE